MDLQIPTPRLYRTISPFTLHRLQHSRTRHRARERPRLPSHLPTSPPVNNLASWTFGDGGTSNAQNPSHQYTTAGTYSVNLTVTGPGGSDSEVKEAYITVTPAPVAPIAAFTNATPRSGTAPLTVTFTDQSTGSITSYSWTFGDGGTSNAQNPSHQYTTAGTYSVNLTVTGPGGSDSEVKAAYIR